MGAIRQIVAVTLLNLRTIPQRLGSSVVGIVGIAGVVVVLVAVLSMAEGFEAVLRDAGSSGRAIVMRSGSTSEMSSGLLGSDVDVIKQAPGIQTGRSNVAHLGRAVRHHRRAEKVDGDSSQRSAPRHRANVVRRARSGVDRRWPDAAIRDERGRRRPGGVKAVRGVECRRRHPIGRGHLEGGWHLRV